MIYLASSSPRRKTLLKKAGIAFQILKPSYEEENNLKGSPSRIVQTHARRKGESCLKEVTDGIVISADTIVYFRGQIIGKPGNMKEAFSILGKLQGQWHSVYTGVAILKIVSGKIARKIIFFEKTKVRLKKLSSQEIENYFERVNPLDKAGAYAIQSSHDGIVEDVKGLFSNAIGLPIEKILKELRGEWSQDRNSAEKKDRVRTRSRRSAYFIPHLFRTLQRRLCPLFFSEREEDVWA